ncbi:MAG: sigma-70 family RNA polymerase sigma factor [Alphaproteobacteria bacterium]|nr:sigma-70 family RNA polymerase sigma factor [Alphaproteobacteria bacterium]
MQNTIAPRKNIGAETDAADFRRDLIELIPYLRAFARTLCGRRDGADDLCQEALAKAWQNRETFEPGTNIKAWLFRILRNQFYSDKRRDWRQTPWDDAALEPALVAGASQDTALAFSDAVRALHRLPAEQREALILVAVGGFSYEEAANICGCAVGTIKSRVARARQELEVLIAAPRLSERRIPSAEAATQISAQLKNLLPQRHA